MSQVHDVAYVFGMDNFRSGGEGGIRTHDTLASMPHFECGAFDHSATSPVTLVGALWRGLSHSDNSSAVQERMCRIFISLTGMALGWYLLHDFLDL